MANIRAHFVKPFRSEYPAVDGTDEDVSIIEGQPLGLQLSIEWKNNVIRQTGTTIIIANPIPSWQVADVSAQLAMSAILLLINILHFL